MDLCQTFQPEAKVNEVDFQALLSSAETLLHKPKISIDARNAATGLGKLALAIVNLLHELLERQAIRRMENGTLNDQQVEDLGFCLMQQSIAIDELCVLFDVPREELGIELGPLGKLA